MSVNNTTVGEGANTTQAIQTVDIIMEPTWLTIVRLTIECIIGVAGIIGNFAVCVAITKHRTLNMAPTNTLIRNVAIGDLASLLISFPFSVVREQFTYWPLGEFTCLYIFPLTDAFFGVSVWSIAAIAVERRRILATDVPRMAFKSLAVPKLICAAIWVFSFIGISLPLVLVYKYYPSPDMKPICRAIWPDPKLSFIYSIAMSLFTYVIPLSLIFVTYCTIKRKLCKSESFHVEMAEQSFSGAIKTSQLTLVKSRSKRFNKIMTPVVVVFAITVFPLTLLRILILFYFTNPVFVKYSHVMFRICFFFYLLNSASNPLIYSIVNKRFRQSFKEMLAWAWWQPRLMSCQ